MWQSFSTPDLMGFRPMAKTQSLPLPERDRRTAVLSLLTGAFIWGLIWYPYRILRDAGIDGVLAPTLTYALAFVFGLFFFRRSECRISWSWSLLWLALSAAGCNLGYVLATMSGEVVRVLLLFYLAPLWTVLLSRALLGEKLTRIGAAVVALSLSGAVVILWNQTVGFPLPQEGADWLGLGAGFSFALFNVLSRRVRNLSIETRSMVSFAGVALTGFIVMISGFGKPAVPGNVAAWILLAVIGIVLVLVNYIVQYGLARVPSNRAIVIMLTELGFAAVASWLLAGESFGLRECIGGAMILGASIFSARMEHPHS
jgi:drug/metabolite transporter (DMT)-like permease